MKDLIANWKLLTLIGSFLISFTVVKTEVSGLRSDVTSLQDTHPDAIAAQVQQHTTDIKEMKESLGKISNDTGYTRGKMDGLGPQLDQFNSRLERLESRDRTDEMKTIPDYLAEMIGGGDKMLASHIATVRERLATQPDALHRYLTEVSHCGTQWEAAAKRLAFWTDRILAAENLVPPPKVE